MLVLSALVLSSITSAQVPITTALTSSTNNSSKSIPIDITAASWTVSVLAADAVKVGEPLHVCNGALIAFDWVLTAARCVYDYGSYDNLFVRAGVSNITDTTGQSRFIMYWRSHPCFDSYINDYNIALLKLSGSFDPSGKVGLIELGGGPWPAGQINDRKCEITGWGESIYETEGQLRNFIFKASHGDEGCPCTVWFSQKRLVCGKDICTSVYGGLVTCDGKGIAVAHKLLRTGCESSPIKECSDDVVSVYIYLCPYLDWIRGYVPAVPASSCLGG